MSRSPHRPTPILRQQVRSLAGVGLPQEDIATIVDCSEKTLRLHYRAELDEGMEEANAAVVGFLLEAIARGNLAAMIFHDKCKGGKKFTAKPKIIAPPTRIGLPCLSVGMCGFRTTEYYVEGEEQWPAPFQY